ncbi:MAG TPA: biopolymer transporter ExbD [Phycisphaerae bacterium]|nr:biopolymer transporter ExbD [Phycisphaerae bacterium]
MPQKRRSGAGTGAVSMNMTPLIDIVFQLIIFFLLTSQFQQLAIEQVVLPMSIAAEPKDPFQYRNVVINIVNPDYPEVKVMGQTLDYRVIDGDNELSAYLKQRKVAETEGSEKLNVILRADEMICYEVVASVMLAAGRAEIQGWWITTDIEEPEDVVD